MSKKVLVIVGIALLLAASTGVYTLASNQNQQNRGESVEPTEAVVSVDPGSDEADSATDPVDEPATDPDVEETKANETQLPVSDSPYEDAIVSRTFTIRRVYDHTLEEDTSPRVVFGAAAGNCYIYFGDNNSFEILLDPSSGITKKGVYSVVGDSILVNYEDGTASEYAIITDDSDNIDSIIVNYGDYDVYFS